MQDANSRVIGTGLPEPLRAYIIACYAVDSGHGTTGFSVYLFRFYSCIDPPFFTIFLFSLLIWKCWLCHCVLDCINSLWFCRCSQLRDILEFQKKLRPWTSWQGWNDHCRNSWRWIAVGMIRFIHRWYEHVKKEQDLCSFGLQRYVWVSSWQSRALWWLILTVSLVRLRGT